jgi:hypothetical protein
MIKWKKKDVRVDAKTVFRTGDAVHERIHPTQKLIVRSYLNGLYYCEALEAPQRKQLVFFERELAAETKERMLASSDEPGNNKGELLKEIPVPQMKVN